VVAQPLREKSADATVAEGGYIARPTGHLAKGSAMTRHAVSSDRAPAGLGPYSQAIVAGGFVFCSGTAGIDPATGTVGDGIEAQTDQALQNLAAILEAAGASMADLVKVTIFDVVAALPSGSG
jgi:hypothetical protein